MSRMHSQCVWGIQDELGPFRIIFQIIQYEILLIIIRYVLCESRALHFSFLPDGLWKVLTFNSLCLSSISTCSHCGIPHDHSTLSHLRCFVEIIMNINIIAAWYCSKLSRRKCFILCMYSINISHESFLSTRNIPSSHCEFGYSF